jgi:putative acetyltransferase
MIREEQPDDRKEIREVNVLAFGQIQEADLVDKLRDNCKDLLSLVAFMENKIIGHILFSPSTIENAGTIQGMCLAPMAVLPEFQGQGFGSELVRAGIEKLKQRGCPFIIVLGHAGYYNRFGFEPASRYGIKCEWEVPDDVFMILVLNEPDMQGISGAARYRPEFAEAM